MDDIAYWQAMSNGVLTALARKFVNDSHALQLSRILGSGKYKIVVPNMVRKSYPVYPLCLGAQIPAYDSPS